MSLFTLKIDVSPIDIRLWTDAGEHKPEVLPALHQLLTKVNHVMATQSELATQLTTLKDQVVKSRGEVLAKIADLETALANAGSTSPEVDAALEALKTEVQTSDDIVPDAP
jgi:ABC-type transporter Mla subunit MlaD